MIVVLREGISDNDIENVSAIISDSLHVDVVRLADEPSVMLRLLGDTATVDESIITRDRRVSRVVRLTPPYKYASRQYHAEDTIIDVKGIKIGGDRFNVIAGPCSIDREYYLDEIATSVKKAGATILRGGAFKPRTSPYSFQGMGIEGIDILRHAGMTHDMPVVSEITSLEHLDAFVEGVDIIQVGARNMQNYELLRALGKTDKVVLLKRGLAASVDELLMSAEYVLAGGNSKIVLCERGIRCSLNGARATLDLTAVPVLKERTHLPVIVDPSHAAGKASLIAPLSRAALAVGADGLMLEVHSHPDRALSDGMQSITLDEFSSLMTSLKSMARAMGKEI